MTSLSLYSGRQLIASLVEKADGQVDLLDATGKPIGTYRNRREAVAAVPGPDREGGVSAPPSASVAPSREASR